MGIKGLAKLLSDEAPDCIREVELKSLHGRKIAIDASMAIYQFLIAVRSGGDNSAAVMLTNEDGETTSHIQGMFNRTIRYITEGVRPVFVFDGKPPNFKSGELLKRREKREKAEKELLVAKESGNILEQDKQSKRLVRAGKKENDDCKRLLQLMGVPIVQAPCEAEAQAATLARLGVVYATGTEDMDALTFRTPVLVRKMTFANASKSVVQTINYEKALIGLGLTHDQFVDLCIMLGCDYCDTIRGVGPKTALKLIREHGCIEKILQNINREKFTVPKSWIPNEKDEDNEKRKEEKKNDDDLYNTDDEQEKQDENNNNSNTDNNVKKEVKDEKVIKDEKNEATVDGNEIPIYVQARNLFNEHDVLGKEEVGDLKWKPCQTEELEKFLVDEMCFNRDRVKSSIDKLMKAYKANSKPQARMDSFFAMKPKDPKIEAEKIKKRKAQLAAASKGNKKAKGKNSFFSKK